MGMCGTTTVNYKNHRKISLKKKIMQIKIFSIGVQNVDYSSKEMDI